MSLKQEAHQELNQLMTQSLPSSVSLKSSQELPFILNVTQIDTLGCAVTKLEVTPPPQSNLDFDTLQTWAKALSQRLTYLLEQLTPIEIDPSQQQIQIRSTRPDNNAGRKEYYEMLLSVSPSGCLKLERYRVAANKKAQRTPIEMVFTRDVLVRLLEDIDDSFAELGS